MCNLAPDRVRHSTGCGCRTQQVCAGPGWRGVLHSPPVPSARVPAPVTTIPARILFELSPPAVFQFRAGMQVRASGLQLTLSAVVALPSIGVLTPDHTLLSPRWLLVEVAHSCTLTWTLSSWLSHRLPAMGTPAGLEGQVPTLATGRVPTVGTLSLPPFPWCTPVALMIQTLGVDRGFLVLDRRCLRHPFPCSVPPTFFASFGGTPPHYPGDGICPPYGQAACPHCPGFSAGSLAPGQPPPGSGAASSS